MVLAAVADHKLGGAIPVGAIFRTSLKIGNLFKKPTPPAPPKGLIAIGKSAGN
jgi:hypothetical protein